MNLGPPALIEAGAMWLPTSARAPDPAGPLKRQLIGALRVAAVVGPVPAGKVQDLAQVTALDQLTDVGDKFLRLQSEFRKTIVFVTHDIDEAIKMGDRIAILQEGSRIAQYDTPEQILTAPANDFVADFIGSGASLTRLNLSRVADLELTHWATARVGTDREEALPDRRSG